jgi:murein DD-endopeptidase MepM/ murein hydrolase activator NlpD
MTQIKGIKGDIEEKKSLVQNQQYDLQSTTATQATSIQSLKDINQSMQQQIAANTSQEEDLSQKYDDIQNAITAELAKQQSKTAVYSGGVMGWPVPSSHNISSPFGPRVNPISGRTEIHTGIDIPAPSGSPIVASAAGKVIYAQWNSGGYGNMIGIDHGGGIATYYCHCSSIVTSVGQTVSRGQLIGRVGTTGYSTGNHCHFEVRVNGVAKNPLSFLS